MLEAEIAAVIKAATDDLAANWETIQRDLAFIRPPTADEVAEYVLRRYTWLDWSRVADIRAEFKDNGATLAIDLAYAPDPEYIIVNYTLVEGTSADGEATRQDGRAE